MMQDPYVYYILSIAGLILCPVSIVLLGVFKGDSDEAVNLSVQWIFGILYSVIMSLISHEVYKSSLSSGSTIAYGAYVFFIPHVTGLWLTSLCLKEQIGETISFIGRLK
jgi:hypothetical protein